MGMMGRIGRMREVVSDKRILNSRLKTQYSRLPLTLIPDTTRRGMFLLRPSYGQCHMESKPASFPQPHKDGKTMIWHPGISHAAQWD